MPTNKPAGSTPRSLLARLLDAFAWRYVGDKGAWRYQENTRSGARRAVRHEYIHGPKDEQWLAGGDWDWSHQPGTGGSSSLQPPNGGPTETPPSGGSSGQRPRIRKSDVIAIVVGETNLPLDGKSRIRLELGTDQRPRQMTARPVVRSYHVTTVDGVPSNVIELR